MEFFQSCYGKPDGKNWSIFNETIPDALDSYKSVFSKSASSCGPDMIRRALGGRLPEDLYEIVMLKDATCVFRAKYGVAESVAYTNTDTREVMFAHGLVFNTQDVASDPANFLSISDDNFKFTVEETRQQPSVLLYDEELTIDKAMPVAGLDKTSWNSLMACIYTQRESRSDTPLYICVSDRKQMKALIYCILIALPQQMRFLFAFSNENSISGTIFGSNAAGEIIQPQRIFFNDNVPAHADYFNPKDASTNVNLRDIEVDSTLFPTYNAFATLSQDEYQEYCKLLTEAVEKLKLPRMSSLEEIELASLFVEGTSNLEEMDERGVWKYLLKLIKKLRENRIQTVDTDDYVAQVLEICLQNGYTPNDVVLNYISALNTRTESQRLKDVFKRIQMSILLSKGESEILHFLDEEYKKGTEPFHAWCDLIMDIPGGQDCIQEFYHKRLINALEYAAITEIYKEGRKHIKDESWDEDVLRQFIHIASTKVDYILLNRTSFWREFNLLQDAIYDTFEERASSAYKQAREHLVDQFWSGFDLSKFSFTEECVSNCRDMEDGNSSKLDSLYRLYDYVEQFKKNNILPQEVFSYAMELRKELTDHYNPDRLSANEEGILFPKIQDYLRKEMSSCGSTLFVEWYKLVNYKSAVNNPIVVMYRWQLPVVCDSEAFGAELARDPVMQGMATDIDSWINGGYRTPGAIDLLDENPEAVKTFKREAKMLSGYKKNLAAGVRKQEKELRKQERRLGGYDDPYEEPWQEEKRGKGLFGGIFGGKK